MNGNRLTPFLRWLLIGAGIAVMPVGIPLVLFPDHTDIYFPFTIDTPPTATFIGTNYIAGGVLVLLAARARTWASARPVLPGVYVFTVLTAIITAMNLRHLDLSRMPVLAWLAIYFSYPFMVPVALVSQLRLPPSRADPSEGGPATPMPVRYSLAVLGIGLIAGALAILLNSDWWPWNIGGRYAPGARLEPYISAWLLGLGITSLAYASHSALRITKPVLVAGAVIGALIPVMVLRASIRPVPAIATGAFLLVLVAVATLSLWKVRRASAADQGSIGSVSTPR